MKSYRFDGIRHSRLPSPLKNLPLSDITILDAYEKNAFELEIKYLKSLDSDRLLRGFCDISGIPSEAELYGGWESSAIQGHTLGHYLCALSQAYASTGDNELKAVSDHIVSVLDRCQDRETGYLAAIPEEHYARIESGNTSGTWVPWYSMHKIISGLIAAYELTENPSAIRIASELGDWIYSRTSLWDSDTQKRVLNVEYGGMNDCLYQLYTHTGKECHLSAAHSFDELSLFEPLSHGEDILNGKHANTTIPKIIGALKRYTVLGEEFYLRVAENFWSTVITGHTYVTGGNSEWEHFGERGILDSERTNCNCETCNSYNMLKLTRELFKITGNRKYADYYENTFINAILSSQNPETGMTTYFQPMATGFFKVYSSETDHFWCCTGSGMESFSKLGDSICFKNDSCLYFIRYTSSEILWREKSLTVIQQTELPAVRLTLRGTAQADLMLRVPHWCAHPPLLRINGKMTEARVTDGFICLSALWSDGDVIELELPMEVKAHSLPDNKNAVAFSYGPWVLSADMGNRDMNTGTTGVNVTVPLQDSSISESLVIDGDDPEARRENAIRSLIPEENTHSFTLRAKNRELVFSPHYMQHKSRYGIYFHLTDKADPTDGAADLYTVTDCLPVGNDQYEFSHNFMCDKSSSGNHLGFVFRDAAPGGFFSYDLEIKPDITNYLRVRYFSGDAGRAFRILVDGEVLREVIIENIRPCKFYDVCYEIPHKYTCGKKNIRVRFEADGESYAGGIFHKLCTVTEKE